MEKVRNMGSQLTLGFQWAFRDELKTYISSFVRSGYTQTIHGAAEIIKEIVANIKTDDAEILFRMDRGYFNEDHVKTIELLSRTYLIKGREYPIQALQVPDLSTLLVTGDDAGKRLNIHNTKHIGRRLKICGLSGIETKKSSHLPRKTRQG